MDTEVHQGPLTDEQRQAIRDLVVEVEESGGWSRRKVAIYCGIQARVITALLKGTYDGDVDSACRKLAKLRLVAFHVPEDVKKQEYADIRLVEDVHGTVAEVIDFCRSGTPFLGLITGPAGCGKSVALQGIARCYPGSLYMTINETNAKLAPFLELLTRELGCAFYRRLRIADAAERICNELAGQYRLLIFDEMHLADKRVLNAVRNIMDETHSPIILAGQPALSELIYEGRHDRSRGATLSRRVGPCLNVETITRPYLNPDTPDGAPSFEVERKLLHSPEDVKEVIKKAGLTIRIHKDALRMLVYIANYPEGGMLGTMVGVLKHCVRVNEGKEPAITLDLLLRSMRRWNVISEFANTEIPLNEPLMNTIRETLGGRIAKSA